MHRHLPLFTFAVFSLAACTSAHPSHGVSRDFIEDAQPTTLYGAPTPIGDGTARSYLIMDEGAPIEVGVALNESALSGLPSDEGPGGMVMPDGHRMFEHRIALPVDNPTPFKFVELDWNPGGHEPPGIYDRPHFDFHFYTISEAERNGIDPSDPHFQAKAERFPTTEHLPQGYITPRPVMAVPRMGVHWVDPTSPEVSGETFTKTFIYGTWDGELIFAEPMVTKTFLESRPDFRSSVATPRRHKQSGYYPGAYRVYWNEPTKEYRVSLIDFTFRQ